MDERYIRNFPALTESEFESIRGKKVLVVGCGGLGGYIIEMLARLGVGAIKAVDGDCFEKSNLNRQLLSSSEVLGSSKAQAARMRVNEINPDVNVEAFEIFLDENNAEELLEDCDIVMDALDNIESRRILSHACEAKNVPLVFGAISGWIAQAALSMPGDGFIDKLYPQTVEMKDKSSLSFTPAFCAAMQCALAARMLCGRKVEGSVLNCFDLLNMEFETINFP